LLRYDENSQGLMGKEQVKWKTGMWSWSVASRRAENVSYILSMWSMMKTDWKEDFH
jgi:hypothetical protein